MVDETPRWATPLASQSFTMRAELPPLSGAGKVLKTVLRREMQL